MKLLAAECFSEDAIRQSPVTQRGENFVDWWHEQAIRRNARDAAGCVVKGVERTDYGIVLLTLHETVNGE